MAKGIYISKVLAVATVVVTVSAVTSIIAMVTIFQMQIKKNPPPPPTTRAPTTPFPTGSPPNLRLPDNLIPEHYKVYLHAYLHTRLTNVTKQMLTFSGNSTVTFKCVKTTNRIFLHSKDLNFTEPPVLVDHENKQLEIENFTIANDESNFLEIHLSSSYVLEKNNFYKLITNFEGELMDDLAGFYRSQYKEEGEDRYLATSQTQPTDARKVFPCFDEPAMKAVFEIAIIHREGTVALSNAMSKPSEIVYIDDEKWLVTIFRPTPKMSTYLLAFTVSEFTYKELQSPDKFKIRTWARPEAVAAGHADYAMGITESILRFFEQYYNIKYPLDKLDQIALPDFSAGAMENWGLITYRETALLYEAGISSTSNREWVATVIAHELAHQWFGNLVTMKWWNDLWLNEGFATYMSYIGVDHIEPDWELKDLFVLHETQPVFQVDSLATSHPLSVDEQDVQTPTEVTELFNSITYSKGAAILRMLSAHLSEPVFQQGVKSYLKAFEYSNTECMDLWSHLQQAAGNAFEVVKMMETWTQQIGYPVITINTTSGTVSQQHFLLNQTSDYNFVWVIPVTVMKSDSMKPEEDIMEEKHPRPKELYRTKGNEWLLANINTTGYYRVNYNHENWQKLLDQLGKDRDKIYPINRGQLIDDAFNLARAKHINITLALNTTRFLVNETEYIPWQSALRNLDYFVLMFDRSEVYGPMQAYMRKQVRPLYEYFEPYTNNASVPEKHTEQYNQISAISVACTNGIRECQEMAKSLFKRWMDNRTENVIPPNLKSVIYCNAIAAGGEEEWNFAWDMYEESTIASERDKLRYGMSCTRNIWILNKYLQYTLNPEKIRKMDAVSTINYIARNVAGQSLAWDFVRSRWSFITEVYGGGIMSFGGLINGVTQRFSTEFELHQLKQFQKDEGEEGLGSASLALEQAIERTEANIKWVQENKQTVLEWFEKESKVKEETF